MKKGKKLPPLKKEEITHIQLVRYAGASGDFNPIHTVVPFAEKAGLGGVIAHGMLIMGFIGQAIGTWFDVHQLQKFSVRFIAITRPGEKITIQGQIREETNDTLICDAKAMDENGRVKVISSFEIKKENQE